MAVVILESEDILQVACLSAAGIGGHPHLDVKVGARLGHLGLAMISFVPHYFGHDCIMCAVTVLYVPYSDLDCLILTLTVLYKIRLYRYLGVYMYRVSYM